MGLWVTRVSCLVTLISPLHALIIDWDDQSRSCLDLCMFAEASKHAALSRELSGKQKSTKVRRLMVRFI